MSKVKRTNRRQSPTPSPTFKAPGKKAKAAKAPPRKKNAPKLVDWKPVFLKALASTGNVSDAAKQAEIHRDSAYAARDTKGKEGAALVETELFARQWDSALETAIDALELEARRRAMNGVTEAVGWYQGEPGGTVQRYSDQLMTLLLKAHRPEKYRENVLNEHRGNVNLVHGFDAALLKVYGDVSDSDAIPDQ